MRDVSRNNSHRMTNGIPILVPIYMEPPASFTKRRAVQVLVQANLRRGIARGKGHKAKRRAARIEYEFERAQDALATEMFTD
jgi:hypothetical protein